jgi:hypothetical protein
MKTPTINPDEMLKSMAAEAVKQHKQIRTTIRDLTLEALQMRELSLKQINSVVREVTEGVNVGVGDGKIDVEKALSNALAGMDEALLKVVEANKVALQKLTEGGASFEESSVKKRDSRSSRRLKKSSSTASSKPPRRRATAPKSNGNPFLTTSRAGEPTQART